MTMTAILLTAAGAVSAAAVAPFALPSAKTVERSRVIPAPADQLFALIASNAGYQRFNPWRDNDPNLSVELFGPTSGVGSGFRFKSKDGAGVQTISATEENRSVTCQLDMGFMGKPVHRFDLRPVDGGTQVTWRMESTFGLNPIGRIFGLFMEKMVGPVCERGLANLERVATTGR